MSKSKLPLPSIAVQPIHIRRLCQKEVQFCPIFAKRQGYSAAGMFVTSAWFCMQKVGVHRERYRGLIWVVTYCLTKGDSDFDVHVTVHLDKFLIIEPIRCTNFLNLFLE